MSLSKKVSIKKKVTSNINNTENEINKLMGIVKNELTNHTNNINEWFKCTFCEKYHHKDYFVNDVYCIHCWAWLNSHEYDLEKGIYNGNNSVENINNIIKKAYPIHLETKCSNNECVFNKIKKFAENKTLHTSLIELLELNKKPKLEAICFNYKNKNLAVNFDESYIVI